MDADAVRRLVRLGAEGDAAAVGRLLTAATRDPDGVAAALPEPDVDPLLVGLTGPPGVGKSCLLSELIAHGRAQSLRIAALCVDPSSPYTGGAVLGDRIRAAAHTLDPEVYIRSFGSRGELGGLAQAIPTALAALSACGFDAIFVETVGVGQNEVALAAQVPTTVLVLSPATGDGIQALKGGVIEAADLIVVNKCELPGAEATIRDIKQAVRHPGRPPTPVLAASAATGEGIAALWRAAATARRERPRLPSTVTHGRGDPTLPELLRDQAERLGERPYLAFGDGPPMTFAGMETRTSRLANALAAHGVAPGDRVALVLPNCEEFVPLWFAAAKAGAIEVPVNPELNGRLLAHVLTNAEPAAIVCDGPRLPALAEVLPDVECRTVVVRGSAPDDVRMPSNVRLLALDELEAHDDASAPALHGDPTSPLAIVYTSGTTGHAKGVVMPQRQYRAFVEGMVLNMGLTPDDHYYSPLPLFHVDAQLFGAYFPLLYGARGTIDERFSASRYWDRIKATGATATNMLGAMAHILWKAEARPDDASNPLRVSQSIPMIDFREEFEERFGVTLVTGYGQTETGLVAHDTPQERNGSACGRPGPGYEVRVVDGTDRPLPPGEVGEIVVRARQPFTISLGYHRMPEATVATTRNQWWHSGDAGHFDEAGWLYFDGRIKDAIRRRGENVSAREVESIVDDHEAVLESAAIAVPSELSEDDIMVAVALRPGARLTPEELIEFCRERMPRHMVPRYVDFHDGTLPRTPSEKIAKQELRDRGVTPTTWDRERAEYPATVQ